MFKSYKTMRRELKALKSESEVTQSCPTLCDPMDCSLPGSSVHGIFQARVLEWVAICFSSGSSQPRNQTWVSFIVGRCFYHLSHQGSPYIKEILQEPCCQASGSPTCSYWIFLRWDPWPELDWILQSLSLGKGMLHVACYGPHAIIESLGL